MMNHTLGPLKRTLHERLTTVLSHHCGQVVKLRILTVTDLHQFTSVLLQMPIPLIKFGVDSSSHFPFRAQTNIQTDRRD